MVKSAAVTGATLVSPAQLWKMFDVNIPRRKNMMVTGPPGTGKTSMPYQWAAKNAYDALIRHPAVEEPTDTTGLGWSYMKDGRQIADYIPFEGLVKILDAKRPTVVIVDDFGQATDATQAGYMPMFLDRLIGGKPISDHISFVVNTNRQQDAAFVSGVLLPVRTRMLGGIYEIVPTVPDWTAWAIPKGYHDVAMFLNWCSSENRNRLIDENPPKKEIISTFCPRTIAEVAELVRDEVFKDDPELAYIAYSARCGKGWANELIGFLSISHLLPTVKSILSDPMNAKLVDMTQKGGPSAAFMVCGALEKVAEPKTIGAILTYAERMSKEIGTFAADLIFRTKPELATTPEGVKWTLTRSKRNVGII